jgi:hypothetical protein
MRIILIFISVFIAAASCKSKYKKAADEIAAQAPDPVNMNAGKAKYSLYIPDGWTTEHRTNYGVDYYYLSAPKTADDPNTSVNVASELMQNLSLDDYVKATIQSVKKAIPSAVILGQGEIVANKLDGIWYSYKMEPQGIKATLVCYIFPKDGVAYIVTAGTQTKDAAKYRDTFDSIAKSFKFKE